MASGGAACDNMAAHSMLGSCIGAGRQVRRAVPPRCARRLLAGMAFRPARHTVRHSRCPPAMSDFELAKLRALGDTTPPGDRTPELEALVGFATTMGEAETLIKAAAARRKQQGDGAAVEQLEPDAFEASGAWFARLESRGCGWQSCAVCLLHLPLPPLLRRRSAAAAAVLHAGPTPQPPAGPGQVCSGGGAGL